MQLQSTLNSRATVLAGAAIAAVLCLTGIAKSRRRRRILPPGPPGLPIVGNLFQLTGDAWHLFTEWKSIYGPIIYLNLAGRDVIVLNDLEVAADLLDRRAAIYSGRPKFIVACDMLTEGLFFTFTTYGDLWRRMRRVAHEGLHKGVVKDFYAIQTKEALILLSDMQDDPKDWENHFRRAVGSTVLSVTYDTPALRSVNASVLEGIFSFTKAIVRAAYVDGSLVEFFPWLRFTPSFLAGWKRTAQKESVKYAGIFNGMYLDVKGRVLRGEARSSFAQSVVEKQPKYNFTDGEAAWLVATVAAGSETMAGVLAWFLLAMIQRPDVQRKAQAEIDAVVGRDRLPSFIDFDRMPYVRAIVKETLRKNPVDPLGMQHASTEDDWYRGHFIPKGTVCIANVWAMNRDPNTWGPDAHEYNPERHLDEKGQIKPAPADTKDESHVTFGFGRRICVGRHLANNSLFLNIASMLWMYNIDPVKDANGIPIVPGEQSLDQGLVVRPLPFDVTFTPRHPDAISILNDAKESLE